MLYNHKIHHKSASGWVICALVYSTLALVIISGPYLSAQAAAMQPTAAQAATSSIVIEVVAPASIAEGQVIQVNLRVPEGVQVAGMETLFLVDPNAAEFAGFVPQMPTDMQGLGMLAAPQLSSGSAIGFYTCGTPACYETKATVAAALTTVASSAILEHNTLVTVTFLPLVAGQIEIRLDVLKLVDATGQIFAATVDKPSVVVQVGTGEAHYAAPSSPWIVQPVRAASSSTNPDLTSNGEISMADLMETALEWQIVRENGSPCGVDANMADVNGDGCVDILDVQATVALLGTQPPLAPEPAQLPYQMYIPQVNTQGATRDTGQVAATDAVIVVTNTNDQADTNAKDGICLTAAGGCSLRAAIMTANARTGADTITFAIPGSGVKTIQLTSRLPSLFDESGSTTINGYAQLGAAMNSDASVSNAQIRIEIRGQGTAFDGLAITSANNVVQGLAFYNFRRALWIYGAGAKDNVIRGDFIGTNAAGTFGSPLSDLQAHGLHIEQGAARTQVGGVLPWERNIISGNPSHGIGLWHWGK